ncbi:hypothetical protein PENARI_c021G00989 [Penicillium arizonense]|uniref:HSF-type DNA-binding domain-containing protein n=1 Tax=Penicillium arizonense TaxID=1835702 RepID=A0A1F5L910_PENAI|nr:hypothetical protein PENARI_c021G00989 [Penicillium arizonense]OGE49401.1 hypothetical protein PENARI_c021G00989 [Penicillium arizonense]
MTARETCQPVENIVNNFISQIHDNGLNPLRLANISVSEFYTELRNHLSVINDGGSIALGRGEYLASIGLSKNLESLFSTTTPFVREGPPVTWTKLVLFAGPHYEGPAQLKVGDSSVELPKGDFKLLHSGRPWRFLSPWPDKDDCMKELESSKMALHELADSRKTISEVLEQISLVEQCLRNHHDLVSQLSENQNHIKPKAIDLPFDGAHSSLTTQGVSDAHASTEDENLGGRDSPFAPTTIRYGRNEGLAQPVDIEPNEPALPVVAIVRNNSQRDGLQPGRDTRSGCRLHASDFIQSLSDVLDDPKNGEALRWSEDGQSVSIAPESTFPAHLLPRLNTKSYQSLVRRLYYYGFHKVGGAYHHGSFLRGQPSSIRPARETSGSPSLPSSLRNSTSQRGPRYKVIKRNRTRESV